VNSSFPEDGSRAQVSSLVLFFFHIFVCAADFGFFFYALFGS
jgi:hypothetical protein